MARFHPADGRPTADLDRGGTWAGSTEHHRELERVIDGIAESYDGPSELNNLGSVALPNKRAAIEALWHLKHLLFLGFYGTRPLSKENLRFGIAEHVYPAEEMLVAQIDRALAYEATIGRGPTVSRAAVREVVRSFLDRIPSIRGNLDHDVRAAYEGDPAANSIEEVIFSYPSIEALATYRLAHELWVENVPMIPRIWSEHAHGATGIDIHPGATIGQGFFMDHGTGVVIGETATIGNRVKLYQGVTLGALSVRRTQLPQADGRSSNKRHPTLEDEVTVYSGASIMGGETVVGAGSVIGANVWLTQSVPAGSKIFGRSRT